MKITKFLMELNKNEQRILTLKYQEAILEFCCENIFAHQTKLDYFFVHYLIDGVIEKLKILINENKFTLLNVFKSIKLNLPTNSIVRDKSLNPNLLFSCFKNIFEKIVADSYINKQYQRVVKIFKLKDVHLAILFKYNKKVEFFVVSEDVLLRAQALNLINDQKDRYFKLNEKYESLHYINDEVLNLNYLYNEKSFISKNDFLKIIDNKHRQKYIILPFEFKQAYKLNQPNIYEHFKSVIRKSSRRDEYYLIIYAEGDYERFLYWWIFIKELNQPNIKTGVIITSFEEIYTIEKMPYTNLIVIDYDEISNFNVTFKYFKIQMEQKLRTIKQVAKENKMKIIMKSNNINDSLIIEKLIIMGFNMYMYNDIHYNVVKKSVQNYMSRRGKYKIEVQTNKKM